MEIELCRVKISHLQVTETELDYVKGSLTLDENLIREAGLYSYEKILGINLNSGERFETYLIKGEPGSGEVCLNGGTARMGNVGDELIVLAFASMPPSEAEGFTPSLYLAEDNNTTLRKM